MPEEPGTTSSRVEPKTSSTTRRILSWGAAIAALGVIVAVIIGAILYYGYMTKPGWVGVSGKKFWDYR